MGGKKGRWEGLVWPGARQGVLPGRGARRGRWNTCAHSCAWDRSARREEIRCSGERAEKPSGELRFPGSKCRTFLRRMRTNTRGNKGGCPRGALSLKPPRLPSQVCGCSVLPACEGAALRIAARLPSNLSAPEGAASAPPSYPDPRRAAHCYDPAAREPRPGHHQRSPALGW